VKKKNSNAWNPLRSVLKGQKGIARFFETQLPMLKYLWPKDSIRLRLCLVASMFFMFMGKWFNTRVPFMLQRAIDNIPGAIQSGGAVKGAGMSVAMAVLLYGLSRATAVFCEELKTCLFTNVSQNVLRQFAHQIFTHLHTLGSDFHLQTPSGVISVAYVRAVRGFQALMFQLVFSVAPMALELAMVARIMYKRFSPTFSAITLATFTSYLIFTIYVTQWRVRLRKEIVEVDNARNGFFIDSLLNQEVVKLFNNEQRETKRFDSYLERMQKLNIDSTYAVAALNVGQAVLFCAGLTASLLVALGRVQRGVMSVGDVVAVNAMLLQLAIPFDFIGYTCKRHCSAVGAVFVHAFYCTTCQSPLS
jgi:ABC-type multidrug transport system fused ATPase/permease subunit